MWPFGKSAKDRLLDALKDQKLTSDLNLGVEVKNKTAIVTGTVPNERFKGLITAVGTGISGIENVDVSGLRVTDATSTATTPAAVGGSATAATTASTEDPSAHAKAAHKKILAELSLVNNPLDVLQKGTTVVLRGAVDSQDEFAKAENLAASVEGVTGVDTSGLQVIENASTLNVTDSDGDIVYTVKSGDTLSAIALKYYGSAGRDSYMKIAEANGVADADKIQVGQHLKIPGTTKGPEAVLG